MYFGYVSQTYATMRIMVNRKKLPKVAIGVLLAVVLVAIILVVMFFVSKPANDKPKSNDQPAKKTETALQTSTAATLSTDYFTYDKPTEWAILAKERLDSVGAITGTGRPPGLSATFTVRVSEALPKNDNDLRDSTLAELKKLPGFTSLASTKTTIDGKSGYKFSYISTPAKNEKVKQDLVVVANAGKTFFLLFSSPSEDFDKYAAEFTAILNSFKFK